MKVLLALLSLSGPVLAADPEVMQKSGRVLTVGGLAREYGFTDIDGRQPPRWADEGMAILADTHAKQMLHERDLTQGIASRAAFRVAELLTFESYPQPSRIPAFYGQSASLTACLAKRDDPSRFVEFLRRSLDDGYDKALRDIYHLDNVAQLEQLWHEQRLTLSTANAGSGYHGVRLALDDASADLALRAQ